MNKELAIQLKNAGFPLIEILKEALPHSQGERCFCLMCGFPFLEIDGKFYMQPVLDVLIEACGDKDLEFWIRNDHARVCANGVHDEDGTPIWFEGETPDEAIGNLYLFLKQ